MASALYSEVRTCVVGRTSIQYLAYRACCCYSMSTGRECPSLLFWLHGMPLLQQASGWEDPCSCRSVPYASPRELSLGVPHGRVSLLAFIYYVHDGLLYWRRQPPGRKKVDYICPEVHGLRAALDECRVDASRWAMYVRAAVSAALGRRCIACISRYLTYDFR